MSDSCSKFSTPSTSGSSLSGSVRLTTVEFFGFVPDTPNQIGFFLEDGSASDLYSQWRAWGRHRIHKTDRETATDTVRATRLLDFTSPRWNRSWLTLSSPVPSTTFNPAPGMVAVGEGNADDSNKAFPMSGLTPKEMELLVTNPRQFFTDNPELERRVRKMAKEKVMEIPLVQALLDSQLHVLMGDLTTVAGLRQPASTSTEGGTSDQFIDKDYDSMTYEEIERRREQLQRQIRESQAICNRLAPEREAKQAEWVRSAQDRSTGTG